MKASFKEITHIASYILFIISSCATIILGVWGFLLPPMGVIDQSVIQFAGILLALATIAQIPHVIRCIGENRNYKIQTGHLTIESSEKQ